MLEIIRALRELGATEVTIFDGSVTNVKFGHTVMLPPATEEAEKQARVTMKKPEDERRDWYRAVAGVSE